MTKLFITFSYDLTSPTAKTVEFGCLTLNGEEFVSFEWLVNLPALLEDFTLTHGIERDARGVRFVQEMLEFLPDYMPLAVEGWQEVKKQEPSPYPGREHDNIVDYLCHVWHRSSYYVSRVVVEDEVACVL